MNSIPISLAVAGLGFLIAEIWAVVFVRRALKAGRLSQYWRRWRMVAFAIGGLLMFLIPLQEYPLGSGRAKGIPFFAAWFDAEGRDYVGVITLPAALGNMVVWFLAPQLVLAFVARWSLVSHDQSHP